jgi:nucleoside-diphosphate-sugar epimerase
VLTDHLLAAGHFVRVMDNLSRGGESLLQLDDRSNLEIVSADICDRAAVQAAMRDVQDVIHLAAIVGDPACAEAPELAKRVNVEGTSILVEEARSAGVESFISFSTCSTYGVSDPDELASEESPLRPLSLYAETKIEAERLVLGLARSGVAPVCLRLATAYGVSPNMRFDLTVNQFAKDAFLFRRIAVYGEQFWRPYIHIQDIAAAVQRLLETGPAAVRGRILNVGATAENYQKRRICELIQELQGDVVIEKVAQADDPRSYRVSFEKIKRSLGFEPRWVVRAGLAEVLDALQNGIFQDPHDLRHYNSVHSRV